MKMTHESLQSIATEGMPTAWTPRGRGWIDALDPTRVTYDWRDAILPIAARVTYGEIKLAGVLPRAWQGGVGHTRQGLREWTRIFWAKTARPMSLLAVGRVRCKDHTLLVTWTPDDGRPGVWVFDEGAVHTLAELAREADEMREHAELNSQIVQRAWERLDSEAVDLDARVASEIVEWDSLCDPPRWITLENYGRWFTELVWDNPYLHARMQQHQAIPRVLSKLFVPRHRCRVCFSAQRKVRENRISFVPNYTSRKKNRKKSCENVDNDSSDTLD